METELVKDHRSDIEHDLGFPTGEIIMVAEGGWRFRGRYSQSMVDVFREEMRAAGMPSSIWEIRGNGAMLMWSFNPRTGRETA